MSRMMEGIRRWAPVDLASVKFVNDADVDYADQKARIPLDKLFGADDDPPWQPFIDGGSPWLSGTLIFTADHEPFVILATQSVTNGRQPAGTHREMNITVSFANQEEALIVGQSRD